MASDGLGLFVLAAGVVSLLFPQVPFHLQHLELEGAEMSAGGSSLYRLLGAIAILIGAGMIAY